jgi:pilus assembly protein Flp/PilA
MKDAALLHRFLANLKVSERFAGRKWARVKRRRKSMMRFVRRFLSDAAGATAIEYALVASLISITIIAGATAIGTSLSGTFTTISNSL